MRKPAVILAAAVVAAAGFAFAPRQSEQAASQPSVEQTKGLSNAERSLDLTDSISPISDLMRQMPADVQAFDRHITFLANPFLQGRLPGTQGMEIAKDYMQHHFDEMGLEPAFGGSWRQPFELGGSIEVVGQRFQAGMGEPFVPGEEFNPSGMGASGAAEGELVFVGYGIDEGPDDYRGFDEGDSLEGKIAVVLRFEPMNEDGTSRWATRGWSGRAGFANKLRAVSELNPAGIVIVNPPGAADPRANQLPRPQMSRQSGVDVPIVTMTAEAGDRLTQSTLGRSLLELRRQADEGRAFVPLGVGGQMESRLERVPTIAENVGGVLRGKGDLADEYIIVGGHLDHLGMGFFGSRDPASAGRKLHPGADDNASGSAGLIVLADKLAARYAEAGNDANMRSVMFIAFDAEESGLNGARHYVRNPEVPLENTLLMINFDMIGRINERGVSVTGFESATGLREFVEPFAERADLPVVLGERMSGASDHFPFFQAGVPVLFSIIAEFHPDYHTPLDTVDKINRLGATQTIRMYDEIIFEAAQRSQRFRFASQQEMAQQNRGGAMSEMRVRFGIMPSYDADSENPGIVVEGVTPNSSAAEAGVQDGDRLVRWDGQKLTDIESWMELLARHSPGDKVNIGIFRDGREQTLEVTLQGR